MVKKVLLILFILFVLLFISILMNNLKLNIYTKNYIISDKTKDIKINTIKTTNKKLNDIVNNYINSNIDEFNSYNTKLDTNNKAELIINTEYYLFNNRYINIKFYSFINVPFYAHPIDNITTYFYDIKKEKFIKKEEIFKIDTKFKNILKDKIIYKYKSIDDLNTENILNFEFLFNDAGVTIYYNKYEIFPGYYGIIDINFSNEELSNILKKGFK